MIKQMTFIIVALMIFTTVIYCEEIDENALFSEEATVTASSIINNDKILKSDDENTTSFSGQLSTMNIANFDENTMVNTLTGNIYIDARLKKGAKVFADIQVDNNATTSPAFSIKELFTDVNIDKKVFLRVGKQTLKWGTSYLWNPTDVISINKTSFISESGSKEGSYGAKVTIPIGKNSFYGFADVTNVSKVSDIAYSGKIEGEFGGTEASLLISLKKDRKPIYGGDFSGKLGGVDFRGEMTMTYGSNINSVVVKEGTIGLDKKENEWIPKISVDLSKSFDAFDEKDRISITGEYYYNGDGYDTNVFKDNGIYNYGQGKIGMKDFIMRNNLLGKNNFSRQYAAVFTSVSKFIVSDATLNLNAVTNLVDMGTTVSTSVSYAFMDNVNINLNLSKVFGSSDSECMQSIIPNYSMSALTSRISMSVNF